MTLWAISTVHDGTLPSNCSFVRNRAKSENRGREELKGDLAALSVPCAFEASPPCEVQTGTWLQHKETTPKQPTGIIPDGKEWHLSTDLIDPIP